MLQYDQVTPACATKNACFVPPTLKLLPHVTRWEGSFSLLDASSSSTIEVEELFYLNLHGSHRHRGGTVVGYGFNKFGQFVLRGSCVLRAACCVLCRFGGALGHRLTYTPPRAASRHTTGGNPTVRSR